MPDLIKPKSLEERLEFAKAFVRRGLATFDTNKDKILQLDEAKETFKNFPYRTEDFFVTKEEAEKDPTLNARYIKLIQDAKDITETERNNLIRVASYAIEGKLVKPPAPNQRLKPVEPPAEEIESHFNNKDYLPNKGEEYKRSEDAPMDLISVGTYKYKKDYEITIKFGIDNKIYIFKHKNNADLNKNYEALIFETPSTLVNFLVNVLKLKLQPKVPKEEVNPVIMWKGSNKTFLSILDKVNKIDPNKWNSRIKRGEIIYLSANDDTEYNIGSDINVKDKKADFAQLIYESILKGRDFKEVYDDKTLTLGKVSYRTGPDFEQMMKK